MQDAAIKRYLRQINATNLQNLISKVSKLPNIMSASVGILRFINYNLMLIALTENF